MTKQETEDSLVLCFSCLTIDGYWQRLLKGETLTNEELMDLFAEMVKVRGTKYECWNIHVLTLINKKLQK